MDKKIKCLCGCGCTLYVSLDDRGKKSETLFIASEKNSRKSFKRCSGVQIDRRQLLKLLK